MNSFFVIIFIFTSTLLLIKTTAASDLRTKTKFKLLVPNVGDIISQPPSPYFYPDTLPNVTLPTLLFTGESHTDLLTLKFAIVNNHSKVFIGARNYVHRIAIADEEEENADQRLRLEQSSLKLTFRNRSACPAVNANEVGLSSAEPTDNDIKVLFTYPGYYLFACGTDNCGRCERYLLNDLSKSKPFWLEDNVADFVGGRRSVYVFEGHYNTASAYYVAVEPDGRRPDQAPPFFSARTFNSYHMRFTSKNSQSESRVDFSPQFSSTHTFRILYGFEHNGYSYLLTLQPPMGNKTLEKFVPLETRLVRICTTDNLFDSYMEIPLVCKVQINRQNGESFSSSSKPTIIYRQAVAATFAEDASALFRKHRSWEKQTEITSMNGSLYVSFQSNDKSLAEFDNEHPLCHFDMADIESTFRSASLRCNTNGVDVQLLETVHGSEDPLECDSIEGHIPEKELVCGHVGNSNNWFIIGRQTPTSKHVLSIANDVLTSIGAVTYQSGFTTQSELLLGTEKGRLMKVLLSSTFDYHKIKFTIQRDSNLGPFMANPAFNPQTGSFYFLSRRSLTEVPTFRCEVYTSCGACFRAEEKCTWTEDNKCKSCKTINQTLPKPPNRCPPEVYTFEPRHGPVEGGTTVAFVGTNFGVNRLENKNSFKVAIGGKACRLLTHNNTYFTCRIEDDKDSQEHNRNTIANEGVITIKAKFAEDAEFNKLGYDVFGSVTLKDRFAFKRATLTGVYPSYGPVKGGTHLIVVGTDLNIGSSISVLINDEHCGVIVRANSYAICEMAPQKQKKKELFYQVDVAIDNYQMILNGNKTVHLDTGSIFNDKENLEKYMRLWSLKLTEHSIAKHPFTNISLFVHLLEKRKSLTIGQSFQYRPNSVVKGIYDRPEDERQTKTWDILYTAAHGGTVITFEGKHMDSALFPMLSLSFINTNTQKPETANPIISNVLCNVPIKTAITCFLPPAPNSLLPIVYRYPLKARYVLYLDGQQIDSSRLPVNNETHVQLKESEILYFPEPEFIPFTADSVLISIQTLHVILEGKYLRRELPYKIRVYSNEYLTSSIDGIKCIIFEAADETVANFIKCKLAVEQEQVENFIDKELHLNVTIGNKTKNIGMIKLQNEIVFSITSSLSIVCGSLIVLIFCIVAQTFIYFKAKRTKPPKSKITYNKLYGVELSSLPTLKNFFSQAYNNLDLYNQLDAIGKIICPNKVKNSDFLLGTGNFGIVTRGKYQNEDIAIKTLKEINTTITFNREISQISNQSNQTAILCQGEVLKDFFKEALIMKDFDHPNVLSLIGVTLVENYPSLLLPFMTYGDLHTYVNNQMSNPDVQHLIEYAIQVARGMTYLAERNFVHRDLAARNCLIGQNRQTGQAIIKVADFGLSREFGDRNYYRINGERKLPFRWMPPESLNGPNSVATLKSDIWSYGVLVWELTTRGQLPYEPLGAQGVTELLRSGRRLSKPQYCPDLIYSIMLLCWLDDPAERPEFKDVLLLMEEAFVVLKQQLEAPNAEVSIPHSYVNLAAAVPVPGDSSFNNNLNPNIHSPTFNFLDTNIRLSLTQYHEKSRSLIQLLTSQHPGVFRRGSGGHLEMVREGDHPEEGSSSRSASPFPPPYPPPPYSAEDDTASAAGGVVVPTSQPNVLLNVAPHIHVGSSFGSQETHFLPTNAVTTLNANNNNNINHPLNSRSFSYPNSSSL